MNKRFNRAGSAHHASVLLKTCFRFGRLRRSPSCVSSPFAHLSLPSNVHAHDVDTRRVRGRREGGAGEEGGWKGGKGVRRENFANGRIIKGDSDHVSGTVHTVTSRAPSQWTPPVGTVGTGEQRAMHAHTGVLHGISGPRVMGFTILHSRGKVPIVGLAYRSHFGLHDVRNFSPARLCQKIRDAPPTQHRPRDKWATTPDQLRPARLAICWY